MRFRRSMIIHVSPTFRYRREFLWKPMTVDHETRWLETASWAEKWDNPGTGRWLPMTWSRDYKNGKVPEL